jgi:hypothetical protein
MVSNVQNSEKSVLRSLRDIDNLEFVGVVVKKML